jgi:uncharacterized protein (DUF2126 family)/transglutaminase-like putative cysteine protease
MSIRVALHHKTVYHYDRRIGLGPQVIRLRPAPHSRTPIESYSLQVEPDVHYLNWMQDPFGNYLARCVFNEPVEFLSVEVDLVANLSSINPFDFFLEPDAEHFPFNYPTEVFDDLKPYFAMGPVGDKFHALVNSIDLRPRKTIDFLVDINQRLQRDIAYLVRLEPGVQAPEETLTLCSGSCRDSAWLMVQVLRHLGFAARFVSGYLIQLVADQKPLEGPDGPVADFTDLHAWTEVYLPGAGWVGLDPTSGLLAGEGHIPLACTPHPVSAAPITGSLGECEVTFDFEMSIARIHEDPRVTKPYTEEEWATIEALGHEIDRHLHEGDVRLTMGGEPTFVSIDDMDGDEWQTAAVGENKKLLADQLMSRLRDRFGPFGLLHHGQGKWYPGESLPRWAMHCYWRKDGQPIWQNQELFANSTRDYGHTVEDAERFARELANRLEVNPDHAVHGFEDVMYYTWRERRLPANVDVHNSKLDDIEERERVARVFEQGITKPVGMVLPLQYRWWDASPRWQSGHWVVRTEELFLLPGDSPMGFRLPIQSLIYEKAPGYPVTYFEADPMVALAELPSYQQLRNGDDWFGASTTMLREPLRATRRTAPMHQYAGIGGGDSLGGNGGAGGHGDNGWHHDSELPPSGSGPIYSVDTQYEDLSFIVRTALCVEPREGRLHLFLPPIDRLEVFLDLITAIEATAEKLELPVVIEGYLPPHDSRVQHIKVTPDPGVIEVNVHPAQDWSELVDITTGVYEDARQTRLGTEKFDLDGSHTGTGGGNHVVLGGATPADSPWLRRPDLLKSFVGYWHNHPSLSYLFSGKFIGPTSQAPRVDETRSDSIYELNIAFERVKAGESLQPWLVDRIFRHLLVDGTGNTHRSEFCIDKLFSPDSTSGRLGLVEFRAFEMPPHSRMSLTQQLLLRALVARFWEKPYEAELVSWNTSIHDRWMLPHYIWQDFQDVIEETQQAGYPMESKWFDAHLEFRYPFIGDFTQRGVRVELRKATEPWYVLGEESGAGYTARYVDSSVERMQVLVQGMTDPRYELSCNGRRVPLHPTGREGEFVAGVRYRAWQPPNCLHPTLGVDAPLVFDLYDEWLGRSVGGCRYHVGHPGGLNPVTFPVNALEAESRRATRFFGFGHTPGPGTIVAELPSREFPMTLDLRRGKH